MYGEYGYRAINGLCDQIRVNKAKVGKNIR